MTASNLLGLWSGLQASLVQEFQHMYGVCVGTSTICDTTYCTGMQHAACTVHTCMHCWQQYLLSQHAGPKGLGFISCQVGSCADDHGLLVTSLLCYPTPAVLCRLGPCV